MQNTNTSEPTSEKTNAWDYRAMNRPPHQERVVQEKKELDEKLAKLDVFGRTDFYKTLPADEQGRLNRQHSVMEEYSRILDERIAAFPASRWCRPSNAPDNRDREDNVISEPTTTRSPVHPIDMRPSWFPKLQGDQAYIAIFNGEGSIAIDSEDLQLIAKESDKTIWGCIKRGLTEGLLLGAEPNEPANIYVGPNLDSHPYEWEVTSRKQSFLFQPKKVRLVKSFLNQ